MNNLKTIIIFLLFVLLLFGCKKSNVTEPDYLDQATIEIMIQASEEMMNFDENYDDGEPTYFTMGKTLGDLYPIKIGRKVTRVERNFNKVIVGDSAKVEVITKYTGNLIIVGKLTPITPGDTTIRPDTIITKPFIETIKRNFTFIHTNDKNNKHNGWKLQAISLPEGSNEVKNVVIKKTELIIPDRDTIIITDPLNTYFFMDDPQGKDIPTCKKGEDVILRVFLTSNSSKDDFVTITYGKRIGGQTLRVKRRLNLISSVQNGDNWDKIYEGQFNIFVMHPYGKFHSVINAVTNETVFTTDEPVSSNTWGIPYKVN